MIIRCVTVVSFPSEEYSRSLLHAPAVLLAFPDSEGAYEWQLDCFIGRVFDRVATAVPAGWYEAQSMELPYMLGAKPGREVNLEAYHIACAGQGVLNRLPATPGVSEPAEEIGEV